MKSEIFKPQADNPGPRHGKRRTRRDANSLLSGASVKSAQKFFLIIAIFFLVLCVFVAPKYYGLSKARQALSQGGSYMGSGDFAQGVALMRYGLEQMRTTNGAIDATTLNQVRDMALDSSGVHGMDSLPALALLKDYGIGVTCAQKEAVVGKMFEDSDSRSPDNFSAALNVAALWMQGCEFKDKKIKQGFDKRFELFAGAHPDGFGMDSWQVKARSGKLADERYAPPLLKQKELDKINKVSMQQKGKELLASVQYGLKRLPQGILALKPDSLFPQKSGDAKAPAKKPAAPDADKKKPTPPPPPTDAAKEQPAGDKPLSTDQLAWQISVKLAEKQVNATGVKFLDANTELQISVKSDSEKGSDAFTGEVRGILETVWAMAATGAHSVRIRKLTLQYYNDKGMPRFQWIIMMDDYAQLTAGRITQDDFVKRWKINDFE